MRRLLDTNAYVALKRGNESVARVLRESSEIVFSTIVLGELLFGFRNGNRLAKNISELDAFLDDPRVGVLAVSRTTADRFGRIAAQLRRAGTPIPSNDIWIAAQTFESGAELITFDDHFGAVAGLVWTRIS